VGEICCKVIENKSLYFPEPNLTFGLDYVLDQDAPQEIVYEKVGKDAIFDVLNGYNGTIFAYGQTGSGKTYTMFGPDINNEISKGIVPRAASDIFNAWDINPETKEIDVRCSMLEIYKENLRDLLTDDPLELKIKESPQKGVYVDGLSDYPVGCEEELLCWISIGDERRVWAETTHNSVSSRSHTIFILQVRQIFNDDTECTGILNLVDLAGSEKVGKSGAQGQIFEEGTKINLSLSALGNVIHALVTNMDHIPYRDSKLTRLLQESLGGNHKTALVVTLSPHSCQLQESISSLKFAQRAKKIKNRVKVNIKNSPDQLAKIIEELREELRKKDQRIEQLLVSGKCSKNHSPSKQNIRRKVSGLKKSSENSDIPESLAIPDITTEQISIIEKVSPDKRKIKKCHLKVTIKRCKSEEKFGRKLHLSSQDNLNTGILKNLNPDAENDSESLDLRAEKLDKFDDSSQKVSELEQENERLKRENTELNNCVDNFTKEKIELEKKLHEAEISLLEEKKRSLGLQDQVNKLELTIEENKHHIEKTFYKENAENVQLKIYEKEIQSLASALEDTENECTKLLKERKEKIYKESVEMCSLTLVEYMNNSQIQSVVFLLGKNKLR